jgi:hypothetical protein
VSPQEILRDFQRRYEGTYIFVQEPESKEENLFRVDNIQTSEDKLGVLLLSSDEVGSIRLNFGSAHTLKFVAAPVGVFQNGPDAYLCRRRPLRQWTKGICPGNTSIVPVTNVIAPLTPRPFNFALVSGAFERKTFTLKEALVLLGKEQVRSVALEQNFSLCQSVNETPDYILMFWEQPVARLDKNGTLTRLYEASFEGHVAQYLLENK